MKRDWDLIRYLLLEYEKEVTVDIAINNISKATNKFQTKTPENFKEQTVIILEDGLAENETRDSRPLGDIILTTKGRDTIDSIREDWVWSEINEYCIDNSIKGLTNDIIITLAKKIKTR